MECLSQSSIDSRCFFMRFGLCLGLLAANWGCGDLHFNKAIPEKPTDAMITMHGDSREQLLPPVATLESSYSPERRAVVFYGNHSPPGRFVVEAESIRQLLRKDWRIEEIVVGSCLIRPGALAAMRELVNLRKLTLSSCEFEDNVLEELAHLRQLEVLSLPYSRISAREDELARALSGLKSLRVIEASVSSETQERLKKALLNTDVRIE